VNFDLIESASTRWPINPVTNWWGQTWSPNQLIPLELRYGFAQARADALGIDDWLGAGGGRPDRDPWQEAPLPVPVRPRPFPVTGYFGPAVTAWRNSLRAAASRNPKSNF
jgi:hypothetical protein